MPHAFVLLCVGARAYAYRACVCVCACVLFCEQRLRRLRSSRCDARVIRPGGATRQIKATNSSSSSSLRCTFSAGVLASRLVARGIVETSRDLGTAFAILVGLIASFAKDRLALKFAKGGSSWNLHWELSWKHEVWTKSCEKEARTEESGNQEHGNDCGHC